MTGFKGVIAAIEPAKMSHDTKRPKKKMSHDTKRPKKKMSHDTKRPKKRLSAHELEPIDGFLCPRDVVTPLKSSQHTDLAPQPGLAEVERLASDGQAHPGVKVALFGQFDDRAPAVRAAIYRLAQESITNTRQHARHRTGTGVADGPGR